MLAGVERGNDMVGVDSTTRACETCLAGKLKFFPAILSNAPSLRNQYNNDPSPPHVPLKNMTLAHRLDRSTTTTVLQRTSPTMTS
jgi:hypothetical protein